MNLSGLEIALLATVTAFVVGIGTVILTGKKKVDKLECLRSHTMIMEELNKKANKEVVTVSLKAIGEKVDEFSKQLTRLESKFDALILSLRNKNET